MERGECKLLRNPDPPHFATARTLNSDDCMMPSGEHVARSLKRGQSVGTEKTITVAEPIPEPSDPVTAYVRLTALPGLRNDGSTVSVWVSATLPDRPRSQGTLCSGDARAAPPAPVTEVKSAVAEVAAKETATERCAVTPGHRLSVAPMMAAGRESERMTEPRGAFAAELTLSTLTA